jgi:hypothetical protein
MDNWFDLLAKRMAGGGVTRREALRRMGGFAGGVMALLGFGRPAAAHSEKPSAQCEQFCSKNAPLKERKKCVEICKKCGQEPERICRRDNGQPFCCPEETVCAGGDCCNEEQVCVNNGAAFCCPEGAVCQNGQCVCPAGRELCRRANGDGFCCPEGKVCVGNQCCKPELVCETVNGVVCCPRGMVCVNGACQCPEGQQVCSKQNGDEFCCPAGTICLEGVCICPDTEQPVCGDVCCPTPSVCRDKRCVCPDNRPVCVSRDGEMQCCPPGSTCVKGACCPDGQICRKGNNAVCCPEGTICRDGKCVCPDGRNTCEGVCCGTGQVCLQGACCDSGQVCKTANGKICCGAGTKCVKGACVPTDPPPDRCPDGRLPCISPAGVAVCCTQFEICLDQMCVEIVG